MRKATVRSPKCDRIALSAAAGPLRGALGIIGANAFELWTESGERRILPGDHLRTALCVEHGVPYGTCRRALAS